MDFIRTALDTLPAPALLYETDLRFVAANHVAYERCAKKFADSGHLDLWEASLDGDLTATRKLLAVMGLNPSRALLNVRGGEGYYAREIDDAVVFMSLLPAARFDPRPDLILTTWHRETARENALISHHRMVSVVKMNETAARIEQAMEHNILQMQAALAAQREMVDTLNSRATYVFRLQENSPVDRS